ncbi:nuclear transport factor 2 family protein [Nakamurella sp. GG22]
MTNTQDVVAEFYAAVSSGDAAAIERLLSPEIVVHEPGSLPYGGEWRGLDGFQSRMTAVAEYWQTEIVSPPEVLFTGNLAAALMDVRFTSADGQILVQQPVIEMVWVADGRIIQIIPLYYDTAVLTGGAASSGRDVPVPVAAWTRPIGADPDPHITKAFNQLTELVSTGADISDIVTDATVCTEAPSLPYSGAFRGADGLRRLMKEFSAAWHWLPNEHEHVVIGTGGEAGLTMDVLELESKQSGRRFQMLIVELRRFPNGKFTEFRPHYFDTAAVAAFHRKD